MADLDAVENSVEDGEADTQYSEEAILAKHRREKKELQARIQQMKHQVSKGDKKHKKEVTAEIHKLELELEARHCKELKEVRAKEMQKVVVADNTGDVEENSLENVALSVQLNSELSIESGDGDHSQPGKHKSKAQKRRERREQKERDKRVQRAAEEEETHSMRNAEDAKLSDILQKFGLAIHEVPSDGDCLYAAIQHQLQRFDIETSVASLRHQCAKYMSAHPGDFMPFLTKRDTGEPYSADDYDKYCHELDTTPVWGGQPEICALSRLLDMPIEVIQAEGPRILTGTKDNEKPLLLLSYHRHRYSLGEHYNSVIPEGEAMQKSRETNDLDPERSEWTTA